MAIADILTGMVVDVSDLLDQARKRGDFVMKRIGFHQRAGEDLAHVDGLFRNVHFKWRRAYR